MNVVHLLTRHVAITKWNLLFDSFMHVDSSKRLFSSDRRAQQPFDVFDYDVLVVMRFSVWKSQRTLNTSTLVPLLLSRMVQSQVTRSK